MLGSLSIIGTTGTCIGDPSLLLRAYKEASTHPPVRSGQYDKDKIDKNMARLDFATLKEIRNATKVCGIVFARYVIALRRQEFA